MIPLLVAACTTKRSGATSRSNVSIEIIANKHADVEAVKAVFRGLGSVTEPAVFWAKIANDSSHSVEHRRRCVFQLFRRHVRKGMSLAEVATKLDRPTWLPDESIHKVKLLGGHIPVDSSTDDSVFAIIVLPPAQGDQSAVYLRIAGEISEGELGKLLRGEPGGQRIADSKLNEIGFSEVQ